MSKLNFTWSLRRFNSFIGWLLWKFGYAPSITTSIADTLELGYGPEYDGFFKYSAPKEAYEHFKVKK